MAEADKLPELRLGPLNTPEDWQIALREIEARINELVRIHNESVDA